jgi:hypothetical protein
MRLVAALAVLALAGAARADEGDTSGKTRLDPEVLAGKQERGYFTGLPLINYDSNTGLGVGGRLYYLWNGDKDDPRFQYTPYLHRIYLQAFLTTGGVQYHALDYDAPYLLGSPYRLRAQAAFERNPIATYFGRGASTNDPLSFPGAPGTFDKLGDYETALARVQPDGTTYADYDRYRLTRPKLSASVERDLFGGVVRVLAGASVAYAAIHDYTGESVKADGDVDAPSAATHLHDDCAAGVVVGCDGGWDNALKLGVAYDTRDFEPNPTSGWFLELVGEGSTKAIGSGWTYLRGTASGRVFVPIIRRPTRIVAAARFAFSAQAGDAPFFEENNLGLTDGDVNGLGGLRTLRGYAQDRFVAPVMTVASLELRWTIGELDPGSQRFAFLLVPFLELGGAWNDLGGVSLGGWKRSEGAAFRVAWNQATIISVDYGLSTEGAGFYVNFGQQY